MSTDLNRAEFLTLVGMDRVTFDARARRKHLPFVNADSKDLDEGREEQARRYKVYSADDALVTIIAEELAKRISNADACTVAARLYPLLPPHWDAISLTSRDISDGIAPETEIMAGVLGQPDAVAGPRIVCGTFRQIAREAEGLASVLSVTLTNVSRCAVVLRARAARSRIDLSGFWSA